MRTPYLFSVFLVLLLAVAAGCQTAKPVSKPFTSGVFSSGSDIGGASYVASLSAEALLAAPRWSSTRDQPPLAPGAAKRAAMKMLSQTVTDARQWKLQDISLRQPFDGALGPEYWIYEIRFSGPKYQSQFGSNMGSTLNLMVLMSWKAIPPERINAK